MLTTFSLNSSKEKSNLLNIFEIIHCSRLIYGSTEGYCCHSRNQKITRTRTSIDEQFASNLPQSLWRTSGTIDLSLMLKAFSLTKIWKSMCVLASKKDCLVISSRFFGVPKFFWLFIRHIWRFYVQSFRQMALVGGVGKSRFCICRFSECNVQEKWACPMSENPVLFREHMDIRFVNVLFKICKLQTKMWLHPL